MSDQTYRFETLQVHAGQEQPDPATDARAVPIYATTSYVFQNCEDARDRFALLKDGNIYSRLENPTQDIFEKRMTALEGGVGALATASGAAAVTCALQNLAGANDHIVAASTIYGGTFNLLAHTLPEFGISSTIVNPDLPDAFEQAIRPNTRAVFVETLGNPNCSLIDIDALAEVAHKHGIPLVVDNTFATPYLFAPLQHGADIVVHSATKFIGGHGTAIGGVIIDGGTFDWEASGKFPSLVKPDPSYHGISFTQTAKQAAFIARARAILLRDMGACLSPFHAFLFLQGLETLSLRVERHVQNALKIAAFLQSHPKVARVNHPSLPDNPYHALYQKYFPNGAGSIFTFEIKGGEKEAVRFIDRLRLFSLLANVADVKSLVIHPASTTHGQMTPKELEKSGIKENTIRLSIGTEHVDDLMEDLNQALAD